MSSSRRAFVGGNWKCVSAACAVVAGAAASDANAPQNGTVSGLQELIAFFNGAGELPASTGATRPCRGANCAIALTRACRCRRGHCADGAAHPADQGVPARRHPRGRAEPVDLPGSFAPRPALSLCPCADASALQKAGAYTGELTADIIAGACARGCGGRRAALTRSRAQTLASAGSSWATRSAATRWLPSPASSSRRRPRCDHHTHTPAVALVRPPDARARARLAMQVALDAGLNVILCIGETKEERDAGKVCVRPRVPVRARAHLRARAHAQTMEVCRAQLQPAVEKLSADDWQRVVIAYEPVWAIGTGVTASPEQVRVAGGGWGGEGRLHTHTHTHTHAFVHTCRLRRRTPRSACGWRARRARASGRRRASSTAAPSRPPTAPI